MYQPYDPSIGNCSNVRKLADTEGKLEKKGNPESLQIGPTPSTIDASSVQKKDRRKISHNLKSWKSFWSLRKKMMRTA